eukprot:8664840-Pyramimonas_sp.AAC.1
MAHRSSTRRSTAQPSAQYIKIDTFSIAFARQPCLTFLYSFPGSWVDHVFKGLPPESTAAGPA